MPAASMLEECRSRAADSEYTGRVLMGTPLVPLAESLASNDQGHQNQSAFIDRFYTLPVANWV